MGTPPDRCNASPTLNFGMGEPAAGGMV